jgi:hypothetical protein
MKPVPYRYTGLDSEPGELVSVPIYEAEQIPTLHAIERLSEQMDYLIRLLEERK